MSKFITLFFLLFMSACSPQTTPLLVATTTLIPVTATPTPITSPNIATPTSLPEPADLIEIESSATPEFILQPASVALDNNFDPSLVVRAVNDLAYQLSIDPTRIQLASLVREFVYHADFACPNPLSLSQILNNYQQYNAVIRYRLVLLVGSVTYTYHLTNDSLIPLCAAPKPITGDLLMRVDPIAAEMVALARRRLSIEIDLPQRRLQLVTLNAYTWSDTSLGCPQEGQVYTDALIEGYRIVMRAGDRDYAFHTDVASLFECPNGREVIPPKNNNVLTPTITPIS